MTPIQQRKERWGYRRERSTGSDIPEQEELLRARGKGVGGLREEPTAFICRKGRKGYHTTQGDCYGLTPPPKFIC